jgi:hypothetical protein
MAMTEGHATKIDVGFGFDAGGFSHSVACRCGGRRVREHADRSSQASRGLVDPKNNEGI